MDLIQNYFTKIIYNSQYMTDSQLATLKALQADEIEEKTSWVENENKIDMPKNRIISGLSKF
jgi:hypothetical protein